MDINAQFPSKYLKASDLNGGEAHVTIKDCIIESLGEDKRPVLYFAGKEKGVVLNKTNATNISDAYGGDTDEWVGKKVTLYTAYVDFQGRSMEAIRIRQYREVKGAAQPPTTPQHREKASVPPQFDPSDPGADDGDIPF